MARKKIEIELEEEDLLGLEEQFYSNVFQNALGLFQLIGEEISKGSKIIIEDKDGCQKQILIG